MNATNKNITFKGAPLEIVGTELRVGDSLPSFKLTGNDMSDYSSESLKGKVAVISLVPSLDTPVCALQTKRFNKEASELSDKVNILTVSRDLPFAQKRFCGAEGVSRLTTASDYKYQTFGNAFGAVIKDWGLLARALFVVDAKGEISHVEYVKEVSTEPDYEAALKKVRELI